MEETTIFKFSVDTAQAIKDIASYQQQIDDLKKEVKEYDKEVAKGTKTQEEANQAKAEASLEINKLSTSQKKLTDAVKLQTSINTANNNSLESLKLQQKAAKAQLDQLKDAFIVNADGSIEATEAYLKQAEVVKQLDAGIKKLNDEAKAITFQDKIKEGIEGVQIFGVSLGVLNEKFLTLVSGGISGAIKGLFAMAKAFLATPLGIIAVAIGTLTALFSRNQKAMEFVRAATAAFGAALDFLLIPINAVIDGLVFLAEKAIEVGAAVTDLLGITDTDTTKSAYELEKALIAVEKAQSDNELRNKQAIALEERLKTLRDDVSKGLEERIKANEELGKVEEERISNNLKAENEKLAILQKQFENEENSADKEELRVKVNEQLLKIAELNEEAEGRRVEQITNQNGLLQEQRDLRLSINETQLELDVLQGKVVKGSAQELELRKDIIKTRLENAVRAQQGEQEREELILKARVELANLDKEFADAQEERNKAAQQKALERAKARIDTARQIADDEIKSNLASLQRQLNDFDAVTETINQKDKKALQERANQRLNIEAELLKKQIEAVKLQEKNDLEDAQKAANELAKIGIDSSKFLAAERKRIQAESNLEIQELSVEFSSKTLELAKEQAEELRALRNEESNKILADDQIRLQNEIAQQKAFGELAIEQQKELAKTQNSAQNELLRQQLENEEITKQEFEALRLQNKLAFEAQIKAIEDQALQDKINRINAEADLNIAVAQSFANLADAFAGFVDQNEEASRALFLFNKALALAEVGINISREISLIGATDANPISSALRIVGAIAKGVKLLADIRKVGFADGGFTGEGSKYEPAGIVHRGEYVVPKWQNESSEYKPLINALEMGRLRGYASGGGVGFNPILESISGNNFADSVANALASMPTPILDVREVVSTMQRIQYAETKGNF